MPPLIGYIGMGIMGLPMATRLLNAGYEVTVHTRTKAKAQPILDAGATWSDSPADMVRNSDTIFINVTDTPDVEAVLFGDNGVLQGARPGLLVVDNSTISPTATADMAARLLASGVMLIDAPVSGGDVGAKAGTLSIMCGGDKQAFDQVKPLLERMGKTITHCGPSGHGQLTKLVNQVLVAGTLLAVAEAVAFAKAGGLDLDATFAAVGGGGGRSWQLEQLGPKMAAGDFAPGFMIDLAAKDLRLVLDFAARKGLDLPSIAIVQAHFEKLRANGDGRLGTQAILKSFENR